MKNKNLNFLKKNGYVVLKNIFTKQQCKCLKDLCVKVNEEKYKRKIKKPKNSKHKLNSHKQDEIVYNLQNKDYKFIQAASNKKVLSIVTDYFNFGAFKKEYAILNQLTGRSPRSNSGAQTLHLDSRVPGLNFPIKIVATLMLEKFSFKNGATRLLPKSHIIQRFPKKTDNRNKSIKYINGSVGDVLIMNGSLWHGGSKNFTKNTRWSILITYVRWFLKQSFDMPSSLPNRIKKKCNKNQLKLLGLYSMPPKNEYVRINALEDV